MKESIVARRYAKAMVSSYSPAELDAVGADLTLLAGLYEECRDFQNVMRNPAISRDVKKDVLSAILAKAKVSQKTETLLGVVLENGRMAILPEIAEEFEALSFEALGKVRVELRSAMELSESERKAIVDKMSEITGKNVVIDMTVDESLIGGVVAKVGSVVYDGSVANQLRALKVGL